MPGGRPQAQAPEAGRAGGGGARRGGRAGRLPGRPPRGLPLAGARRGERAARRRRAHSQGSGAAGRAALAGVLHAHGAGSPGCVHTHAPCLWQVPAWFPSARSSRRVSCARPGRWQRDHALLLLVLVQAMIMARWPSSPKAPPQSRWQRSECPVGLRRLGGGPAEAASGGRGAGRGERGLR